MFPNLLYICVCVERERETDRQTGRQTETEREYTEKGNIRFETDEVFLFRYVCLFQVTSPTSVMSQERTTWVSEPDMTALTGMTSGRTLMKSIISLALALLNSLRAKMK
jgi:hypothetical protein